jgi:predicted porin
MIVVRRLAAAALATAALSSGAWAQTLEYHSGALNASLHGSLSAQAGSVRGEERNPGQDPSNVDKYARLAVDWTSAKGWLFGASLETTSRGRATEALNSGEAYLYFSSGIGRIEIGKQDGAADALAFHAPVLALGQIRGDFARYAGTQALLSAYDTGDAEKIVYLSPPISGVRFGMSYAPEDHRNKKALDPRDRTIQKDAIELGIQYQRPVGDWVLGASGGYVHGKADPITERQDLDSWTVGLDARKAQLRLGAAYVDRGDSNLHITGFNQTEINAGLGWVEDRWGMATSVSRTKASGQRNDLIGIGGYFDVTPWATLRADLVHFDETISGLPKRDGFTAVGEVDVHF